MKKDIKLYNVLFPLWFLLLFPIMWPIILVGNFIIDSIVLLAAMWIMKMENKKEFYKNHILKVYSFGLCADIIGEAFLFGLLSCGLGRMGDEPYLTVPALILSSVLIFVFNYFITFKKCDKKLKLTLALVFAIITAPYAFLVPSSWLYG